MNREPALRYRENVVTGRFAQSSRGNRLWTLISVFLALLLGSLSHKISPTFRVAPLSTGKSPRPSRRAQPPESVVRRAVAAEADDHPEPDRELRRISSSGGSPPLVRIQAGSDPERSPEATKPAYLKFYDGSSSQHFLSPPA